MVLDGTFVRKMIKTFKYSHIGDLMILYILLVSDLTGQD